MGPCKELEGLDSRQGQIDGRSSRKCASLFVVSSIHSAHRNARQPLCVVRVRMRHQDVARYLAYGDGQ